MCLVRTQPNYFNYLFNITRRFADICVPVSLSYEVMELFYRTFSLHLNWNFKQVCVQFLRVNIF